MKPEYVAKKSVAPCFKLLRILFFWLIIPLIVLIVDVIKTKHYTIEFYNTYTITKWGVFAKHEKRSAFAGVVSVGVDRSLGGRMFNYGDVRVDVVGKWDINTQNIKDPLKLKNYLEGKLINISPNQATVIA